MDKGTFDKLIASPVDITTQEVSQLEDLLASFPYCQVAHLLLAKESHDKKSMLYPQKLRKASTYALDRRVLYNVINRRTNQEKAAQSPVVVASTPEKKTAYESPQKSANNQNSTFLRELEDNLKLLKEQTKKHDFATVTAPTEEDKALVADSIESEQTTATDNVLLAPALESEIPQIIEQSINVVEIRPLPDKAPENEVSLESVVQNLNIVSSAPLEKSLDDVNTVFLEEKNALLDYLPVFQTFNKEESTSPKDIEEKGNEGLFDGIPNRNNEEDDIMENSPDSHTLPLTYEDPVVAEMRQTVSENDSESRDNSVPIPQTSSEESIQSIDNLEDPAEETYLAKTEEQMGVSLDSQPILNGHPTVDSLDLPPLTIMETKLGSELSFEASSGTEEIELFLAYLRKNAPIKAPIEIQSKIIEKFIVAQPTITRHSPLNFNQDNEDLAKSSISLRTELVTENYANILVKQNNIAKAIEVYKKLILKNPDKSAYFAAKLYELQSR